uniref:Annexin n=1 Tax=Globodera pallida TaxID=36090 RepID=A0A183CA26_GLOPA
MSSSTAIVREMGDPFDLRINVSIEAQEDAQKLWRAGQACLGTDEIAFNEILGGQNFAQLHLGLGTSDNDLLVRLVVSRSEIDMAAIRKAYQKMYRKSLEVAIADDCSSAYKALECLLELPRISPFNWILHPIYEGSLFFLSDCGAVALGDEGSGSDKSMAILQPLINCNNAQRQELVHVFKQMHGKDLITELKRVSGEFQEMIMAAAEPCAEGAWHKTSSDRIRLTTRTNAQIHHIKLAYRQAYDTELKMDVEKTTSGHFRRLLISLCSGAHDEHTQTSTRIRPGDC